MNEILISKDTNKNININEGNEDKNKDESDENDKKLIIKIADLEKELSNQKIKNEELIKDISAFNSERKDFLSQIES